MGVFTTYRMSHLEDDALVATMTAAMPPTSRHEQPGCSVTIYMITVIVVEDISQKELEPCPLRNLVYLLRIKVCNYNELLYILKMTGVRTLGLCTAAAFTRFYIDI